MINEFDYKQKKIIYTWFEKSKKAEEEKDMYSAFISSWICFNAFCYGKYEKEANQRRVDIDKDNKDIFGNQDEIIIRGRAKKKISKDEIRINEPGKLFFSIKERYAENIIFQKFSEEYQNKYEELLKVTKFKKLILDLQDSLNKDNRFYVINMTKIYEYYDMKRDMKTIEEMSQKNVVVLFEDISKLSILKDVLYQIRNNIFHGEKTPGDPNDDKIVSASFPVLSYILKKLVIEKL